MQREMLETMDTELNQNNKNQVLDYWTLLDQNRLEELQDILAPDLIWHGFEPVGELSGVGDFLGKFWGPLRRSFPTIERRTHIFMGGESNGFADGDIDKDGHMWVSGTGLLEGAFENDYLGIPANGENVQIRWGEFCRLEQGKIIKIYFQLDLIDLAQQVGVSLLPPSRGRDGLYPPPGAGDGVLRGAQEAGQSAYSLQHIRQFIFEGLNGFDQSDLKSMGMADYFHPQLCWYGPGGIGACLSFKEF